MVLLLLLIIKQNENRKHETMKSYTSLFFLILCLLVGEGLDAQRRALGKPVAFLRPIDIARYEYSATKDKEKSPWIVVCDQDNVQTFEKVSKDGELTVPKESLKFKDWFYVSDETDCCVRIFKGQINSATFRIEGSFKDYGWINKGNILLWTSSLTDAVTKIDLKAFLLNKASDVNKILKLEKKEIVKIYSGPTTGQTLPDKTIYEFYFVLKQRNDKCLLAKNANINPQLNPEDLVGWVRKARLELWNTRVCLEPNFQQVAFLERQNNPNFHLIAYGDQKSARSHSETGIRNDAQAIWVNDPVILTRNHLAESDPRRFKGGVVRFPMLSDDRNKSYFRSGVIGKIHTNNGLSLPEPDWATITQLVEEREVGLRENFDVLFLIEGTRSMANYKAAIEEAIKKVSQELVGVTNVRYGVAVYRDTPEKAENKLFEIHKMNSSLRQATDFVSQIQFARWRDNDNYTAMYYGMNQAIIESGMSDQHTNIVFVIGNNADLKSVAPRKNNDECYIKTENLAKKLADFNTHIVAVQCRNIDREGAFFSKNIRTLMLESANVQYRSYNKISSTIPDFRVENPDISDDNQLKNGANVGIVIAPKGSKTLSQSDMSYQTGDAAKTVYQFVDDFWEKLNQLMEDGASLQDISPDDFASPAANILFNIVEEGRQGGITNDNLRKITQGKYKLYTEVFIPKKIKGATYDVYSQVLFMPENDLEQYIDVLDVLTIDLMKPEDELRKGLHRSLTNLVQQYTGHKTMPKGFRTNHLRAVMQGVNEEGMKPDKDRDFAIENVLFPKRMSIQEVREFSTNMVKKVKKLKSILKDGKGYEFSYSSKNNTYFWIPIEDTF